MRSQRATIFWISAMTLLMGPFNNCSPVGSFKSAQSSSSQKLASPGGGYNGGGFSGKASFLHYAAEPLCPLDPGTPESVIDFEPTRIVLSKNVCANTITQLLSQSDIFMNMYDSYYLAHKDEVFIDQSILAVPGPGYRSSVYAFCFNPTYKNATYASEGLDFAIRMESVFNNGWKVTTFGHAIYGHGASAPYEEEIPGKLQEAPTGEPPFVAMAGKYRLDFETKVSPTRGPGVLTIDSGERVPVDCYFLKLKGPGDPQ